LGFTVPIVENDEIITQTNSLIDAGSQVLLEEFLFTKKMNLATATTPATPVIIPDIYGSELGAWLAGSLGNSHEIIIQLTRKLAIVSDEVFADFVKLYTVKMTRNRINPDTGTADGGALFNEEFLPSESLLYSFALASDEFKKDGMNSELVIQFLTDNFPQLFRLGGNKSIGKGLVRQQLVDAIPAITPSLDITRDPVPSN